MNTLDGVDSAMVARATRILLERTARTVGADFFMAMARGIAETLGTRYGLVGALAGADTGKVRTLAVWNGEGYAANFDYDLAGTPCADVMAGDLCHHASGVAERFPADVMLAELAVESYLGLPIVGASGKAVGIVVALHVEPTRPLPELRQVLSLFADRAAAELERIRAEEELARSEARYRQIVSTCTEGVWTIDAGATTTFVNRQMAKMLGYAEEEMLGRPLFDFMDAAARAEAEKDLERRALGVAEHHEFRFLHKEGHEVWTLLAANPLYDAAGNYAGALALATDMTERRRIEAAAQQAKKLESLGVLAGGVAHDFNNLLVGILGNAEIALREPAPPRDALEDIRAAALRAAELTRQLLAFAGKGTFVMSPVDLDVTVASIARLISNAISKNTVLRIHPSSEPVVVDADPGQLNQLVMNLLTNASEALGDEPGLVKVTTGRIHADAEHLGRAYGESTLPPGEYVYLEVTDTGAGMSASTQARIFDPFFTTKFTGRGLGLAAIPAVLRAHRGAIRVESRVGKGSTFTILLPATQTASSAVRPAASLARVSPANGRVVLVVDDEAHIRAVVTRVLSAEGYIVYEAADGPAALMQLRTRGHEIDVLLLDLTMPGMSGDAVHREVRRTFPDLRIVVTSGYAEDDVASRLSDGRAHFLAKPWTASALAAAVSRAMEA